MCPHQLNQRRSQGQEGQDHLARFKSARRDLWNWFLDTSVFFSFDASGLKRHRREIERREHRWGALSDDLSASDHFVVTGANSGLGFALADQLLARGATVSLICRNASRGKRAQSELASRHRRTPSLYIADLTERATIDRAVAQLKHDISAGEAPPIRCLVHNAGLLPTELSLTETGHELTVSAHLIGPIRLTAGLMSSLADRARVLWVSSGGMYTAPLDLKALQSPPAPARYQGVQAYALTKRAQVELATHLHKQLARRYDQEADHLIDVQSAHPGWADTPGVERSLKRFHEKMAGRLRTSQEGAEALTWLCALPPIPEHHFWFDWAPRSPYLLGKRPKSHEREALWRFACEHAGVSTDCAEWT